MERMAVKCRDGIELKFEERSFYYRVTVGNKSWYWNKETGKYDGVSIKVN